MNRRLFYIASFLVFLFLTSYSSKAQNFTSNLYSMYGLGELHSQTNIVSSAMGDAGIGISNSQFLNILNPASYCQIDSLHFLTNIGIESKRSKFQTKSDASHTHDVNLSYIAIGFRPKKWLGMGFGINPYSTAGYNIQTNTYIEGSTMTYPLKINGSGNINRIYMSFSVNPLKNLYLGVENSFLFGKLKQIQYHDLSNISSISVSSEITNEYKNFIWEFGMQYKIDLKKNQSLTIGAIYTPKQHLATDSEIMTYSTSGKIYDTDDDMYDNDNFSIPNKFGLGIAFSKNNKYTFLLDGGIQCWSESDYYLKSVSLTDSPYLKTGFEYTPSRYFMDKYYKKISYRVGYHFEKSYLKLGSYQQYENTISCGLGLPLNNNNTKIDLSFEVGKKGKIGTARIFQEKFFRVKLGLSLIDLWFTKRKYN